MLITKRHALRAFLAVSAGSALGVAGFPRTSAAAASDQQATVDHALGTLQDLRNDKAFGTARDLFRRTRAVMIAPRIFKAGFFFGGEGGAAVLLARSAQGWSNPAFYSIGSASFGLQIGVQQSELILFIMTQRALDAVMTNEFKIGATAGITAVTLGSNVEASTTSNMNADIIGWASSSGAYIGISLNGSVITPQEEGNRAYYGRPITAREIVLGGAGRAPAAQGLVRAVGALG